MIKSVSMKKMLTILTVLILVGVGLWFVWNKYQFKKNASVNPPFDISEENLANLPDMSNEADANNKEEDVLKIQALEIVSRPIVIKVALSDSIKNQAIEKIKNAGETIKNDYVSAGAWLDLGAYRKLIGDYSGAIEAWNFLTVIYPKDPVAFNNLGDIYAFYLKDFARGEQNFLKAIANDSTKVGAYMQLVTIYQETRQLDKMEPLLLSGIKNNSADPTLKILLARFYVDQKRVKEALELYESAVKLDPNNKSLAEELNILRVNQGLPQ